MRGLHHVQGVAIVPFHIIHIFGVIRYTLVTINLRLDKGEIGQNENNQQILL